MNKEELGLYLVARWLDTVNSHDVLEVAFLYDMNDCILLPTVSNDIFLGEEIVDYFNIFLSKKNLKGDFVTQTIDLAGEVIKKPLLIVQVQGDNLICSGAYVFSFEENGRENLVHARFTFVFSWCEDCEEMLIINHHSSIYPED